MYQYAINDYFAITEDNKVKEKGMFITAVKLGKGLTPKIIPKAVISFFKDGIPVEDTIKNCTDIRDFLMSEKTGKQWHVEYMNEEQQRTNRSTHLLMVDTCGNGKILVIKKVKL